jgi:hypothetical protein
MRFYDMKKITLIASLLLVFAACQKADIRPRTGGCTEPETEVKNLSTGTSGSSYEGSGNPNALGGNGSGTDVNPTVDPNAPDPDGGDITDPLRKKDQKDNK